MNDIMELILGIISIGVGVFCIYQSTLRSYPEQYRNWFFRKAGLSPELDRLSSIVVGVGACIAGVMFLIAALQDLFAR